MQELSKTYDHTTVEDHIYQCWLESGYFNPDNLPHSDQREPFVMSLPPPNVTGVLHMGHAFEGTLQDVIIRYQRMRDRRTLWVPGTDHAAIATQAKFEKELYKKEKKSRHDFSREEFFHMIQEFALYNQQGILSQLHKLGLSLDWSRLAFTLDQERELAVRTAFKAMHEAGLIYRAHRVINWDPKGQTTVSDDEIEYEETTATLYTFRYSQDFPISIATTRPETKVGDTAVAVHPSDARYQQLIGQEFDVEFVGIPLHIKIIGDETVDPAFGTGALGVTPAHSMADYEMAQRHNLPLRPVIDEFAKMTVASDLLRGKKTTEARKLIVEQLRQQGLLEKEEEITQNLSKAQRTGGIIEPLPKLQWFVDVNKKFTLKNSKLTAIPSGTETTLKDIMRKTVESEQIKIMPERLEKIYYHWIDNLRDWCISRQIIYGHRIPVWYREPEIQRAPKDELWDMPIFPEAEVYCGVNPPKVEGWQQDHDTLDTWFSAGLWTFSTLGWPNKTQDLQLYHPNYLMMPGYEILFFWVARMILMSGFLLGDIPFKHVVLHGMVRDKQGRKFSKSLNNGVDPLEMTAKYGTDALRMALVFGAAPGNDVQFDEQKVKGMKHFANKLWNIARFILAHARNDNSPQPPLILRGGAAQTPLSFKEGQGEFTDADRDILTKLQTTIKTVTGNLDSFRLHEAAQTIYDFTWHELADKYLEASKEQLKDENLQDTTYNILLYNLQTVLKLLHPFMPFITEEIWSKFGQKELLIVAKWPK